MNNAGFVDMISEMIRQYCRNQSCSQKSHCPFLYHDYCSKVFGSTTPACMQFDDIKKCISKAVIEAVEQEIVLIEGE